MGSYDGFEDRFYEGRRPNGIYIPRYKNIDEKTKTKDFIRGFGYQGSAGRGNWSRGVNDAGFGATFKDDLTKPGGWGMFLVGFGECLPYHENKVTLNHNVKNKWDQPLLSVDCEFKENEMAMRKHMSVDAVEMLESSGLKNVVAYDNIAGPGVGVHEMGTARMGKDPKTSVLNAYNQMHSVPNVFVTDGACMTSSSCQNPSITYMALTARAVDYAVSEMKKRNI